MNGTFSFIDKYVTLLSADHTATSVYIPIVRPRVHRVCHYNIYCVISYNVNIIIMFYVCLFLFFYSYFHRQTRRNVIACNHKKTACGFTARFPPLLGPNRFGRADHGILHASDRFFYGHRL